jgi:hypothetical protein
MLPEINEIGIHPLLKNKEKITMAEAHALVVHKSLISWIISKNTWLQVVLVITAIFAVFANVFPLEMQRRIINDAINLRKFDLLVFYCGLYLIAVIAASMLKVC